MKTQQEIKAEIADLYSQLKTVRGTKTEVYTRIVGYYRDVHQWNVGKQEEYKKRVEFNPALRADDVPKVTIESYNQMLNRGCGCSEKEIQYV
jgi:hypothetical protein